MAWTPTTSFRQYAQDTEGTKRMFTAAIAIHILVSLILIITVLLQVGKGATIGQTFGGGAASQTVFGTSGGATFLGKVTTVCAAVFMITSLFLTYYSSRQSETSIMGDLPEVSAPAEATAEPAAPVAPAVPAMEGTPDPEAAGGASDGGGATSMSAPKEAPAKAPAPAEKAKK